MRILGLDQGNFAPGIMGPGRPFRLPQGFGPFGGIGRPNVSLGLFILLYIRSEGKFFNFKKHNL
jgi:hypothetical protein